MLAIGVGNGAKKSELNAMATDPDSAHVYTADNFDALGSLQALLSTKACEGNVVKETLHISIIHKACTIIKLVK